MDKLGIFHANQTSMCPQVGETKVTTTGSFMNYCLSICWFRSHDLHKDKE